MQISTTKKWGLEPHPKLSHRLKQSCVTFILQRFSLLPYWATFFRIQSIPTNVMASTSRWVDIYFQLVVLYTRLWVMFSSTSPVHLIPYCLSEFCAYGSRKKMISFLGAPSRPLLNHSQFNLTCKPNVLSSHQHEAAM